MVYERRIVAFLDVMGWENAIAKSLDDADYTKRLGVALSGLKAQVGYATELRAMDWPSDPQVSQFSDTIILSYALTDESAPMLESALVSGLQFVIRVMLAAGLFVRGGIILDKLIHKESIAYGPAMKRAWDLEKEAYWPRILLHPDLARYWAKGVPVFDKEGHLIDTRCDWRTDDEGNVFYDFLRPWPVHNLSDHHHQRFMEKAREAILRNVEANRLDEDIIKKYFALIAYFNSVCEEYPGSGIQKIAA